MTLSAEHQGFLADWVKEAQATLLPEPEDTFILAIAAELTRLQAIQMAVREYLRAMTAIRKETSGSIGHDASIYRDEFRAHAALVAAVGGDDATT